MSTFLKDKSALLKRGNEEVADLNREMQSGLCSAKSGTFASFQVAEELLKDSDVIIALKDLDSIQAMWSIWNRGRNAQQNQNNPPVQQYIRMAPRLPTFECYSLGSVCQT